ncbi:F0F1 ATP synthase subunit delta [Devosia pacifica]|uniref:F0F1 ATP synthase subunit delta n=1 Tax=Devosia pacifica TaxID=1335967 RepID=UPI001AEE2287|nr:F0F1 ATP synthase subunit delta [Devosia pacifica]
MLVQIARPYASALFDVARSENQLASVETALSDVSRLLGESEDFSTFLKSPAITTEAKASAMNTIIERSQTNPLVANVLRLMARNGRLFVLPQMIEAFKAMAAESRGEITADVTSASPLNDGQVSALRDALAARVGKSVTLNQHVDASLIGGLQVKIGSQMIDSSLKTKLSAMKIAMKEVG